MSSNSRGEKENRRPGITSYCLVLYSLVLKILGYILTEYNFKTLFTGIEINQIVGICSQLS